MSKSLKKAENGPFSKNLFPITGTVYAAASFSRKLMWRLDVHVATSKFVLLLFCKGASYLLHSDCFVVILKFRTVRMFLQAIRNFVSQRASSSQHVSFF